MTVLFDISQAPLAAAFGCAGLAGQIVWPMFKSRPAILTAQLVIALCYATQYALLGRYCGTTVCLIGATQTLVALAAGDRPWLSRLGLVFLPVLVVASVMTWSGLPTILSSGACAMVMMGRMQRNTFAMRGWLLAAAPLGISFDLVVGAVPALIGGCLSLSVAAVAFRREWRQSHGLRVVAVAA